MDAPKVYAASSMIKAPHKITGEFSLIGHIRHAFPERNRFVSLGIGDDCAILRPPRGHEILVTTDFSLENRHFRRGLHPPVSVGHRCLARGLSDLAAMGATPLAAFLSLAIPSSLLKTKDGRSWLDGFLAGLRHLADQHNTTLAGGDTSESPGDLILADIVLIGSAPRGQSLRRGAAQAGDAIYVTGSLGGAHAELSALLAANRPSRAKAEDDHPHFFPQPRLAVGSTLLCRRLANAAIDISDGLSTDLNHLCESSGLRVEIDATALPLHPLAANLSPKESLHAALHGGEDYELLFTAPAAARIPRSIVGTPITRIGTTMHKTTSRKPRITLIQSNGQRTELKPAGWEHLSTH